MRAVQVYVVCCMPNKSLTCHCSSKISALSRTLHARFVPPGPRFDRRQKTAALSDRPITLAPRPPYSHLGPTIDNPAHPDKTTRTSLHLSLQPQFQIEGTPTHATPTSLDVHSVYRVCDPTNSSIEVQLVSALAFHYLSAEEPAHEASFQLFLSA